ncbi:MAG: Stk1 family PASTA domain-containing Ser/Thr kinase [Clostridiales Family XIII bacterium]|jgi:serine/threonine-protein kinase|nr:Stk1 family PASTA domain-containing Ser/Thr kinase [Clostridiales Family XIII bacterium]
MSEMILAGRYEIIEKIGDGGMAVVYKGRDRLLNRHVAIKVLRPEYTKDAVFVESFKKESQSAARLSHPNIVNVYDVGKEGSIHYIVMELIEGKTLSEVIGEEGAMDYKRTIGIAKQIASALSMAHKNNIIHRDIKPHNILIMPDGSAKITDFGIAKAVSDATIVEKSEDAIMGSVHYFSPEQARGGYVDEKSDIYSLGIVMYEMLTGRVPFDAENPVTVAVMHMNDKPTPPSQLVSGVPPGLEQIVMKAIEKYQINRFKSADDVFDALENVNFITGIIEDKNIADMVRSKGAVEEEAEEPEKKNDARNGKGDMKKSKKKKGFSKIRIVAVALALVCAIPASYFIYVGIQAFSAPKEVALPNVAGMTEDEASAKLEELGLKLEIGDLITSQDIEEGLIVSQERPEGNLVKEGFTLRVNISRGAPAGGGDGDSADTPPAEVDVKIPNLVGRSLDDARRMISNYGYKEGEVTRENSELPVDYVIRQSPDPGVEAEAETRINLVLSQGKPEPTTGNMPNLLGLTREMAARQLANNGLTFGAIVEETSDRYEAGQITGQQYRPEEAVEAGSKVDVKISVGTAAPASGPKTVVLDIDFVDAPSEVFTLTVMLSDSQGKMTTVIDKAVRYKSNGGDAIPVSGEGSGTIYVLFSNEAAMSYSVDFTAGRVTKI